MELNKNTDACEALATYLSATPRESRPLPWRMLLLMVILNETSARPDHFEGLDEHLHATAALLRDIERPGVDPQVIRDRHGAVACAFELYHGPRQERKRYELEASLLAGATDAHAAGAFFGGDLAAATAYRSVFFDVQLDLISCDRWVRDVVVGPGYEQALEVQRLVEQLVIWRLVALRWGLDVLQLYMAGDPDGKLPKRFRAWRHDGVIPEIEGMGIPLRGMPKALLSEKHRQARECVDKAAREGFPDPRDPKLIKAFEVIHGQPMERLLVSQCEPDPADARRFGARWIRNY